MPELVNQPYQLLKWWPQAIMLCNCKKDAGIQTLIVLTGVSNRVVCENCKKSYYIKGFIADPALGPQCIVDFDLPVTIQ